MKATIIICALALLAACKKSNSDAPAPLRATINDKQVKVTHIQTNPDIHYNNRTLLSISGSIDGDDKKKLSVTMAYQDFDEGESIDLGTGGGGGFITYDDGAGNTYGAGEGYSFSGGTITLTLNDRAKRKIEGTLSGVLVQSILNLNVSVNDGHFSTSY